MVLSFITVECEFCKHSVQLTMSAQVQDLQHKYVSLIDDAFNQRLDFKTLWTFEVLFEHYINESWHIGHHQNTIVKLQEIMKCFNHKLDQCGLEINQYDSFLCNNNKKEFCMKMLNDMNWMDYHDWHKYNIKINKRMKEMNNKNQFKLVINNILWVSHCKGAHMSPQTLLRNNPDTLHARLIFQFAYHHLFTCYAGADCNGDTPGNTGGKNHRFLDSMTQNNYKNRNLSYTKGLKWNYTLIKMTTNNADINAAIRNPETKELTFTCAAMCGIFEIAFIFSIIYNRNKLKEIQKNIVLIIKQYNGLDKNLLDGKRKKELHKLRRCGNEIIQKTANLLMDHIVPRTQTIIDMVSLSSISKQSYKIQARMKKTIIKNQSIIRVPFKLGRGNKRKFNQINEFNSKKCDNIICSKRQRI